MSRSNAGRVRLLLTRMARERDNTLKHALKLAAKVEFMDKQIAAILAQEAMKDIPGGNERAVHRPESEGTIGSGLTDGGAGGTELPNNDAANPVLAEQPTELPNG